MESTKTLGRACVRHSLLFGVVPEEVCSLFRQLELTLAPSSDASFNTLSRPSYPVPPAYVFYSMRLSSAARSVPVATNT